MLLRSYQPDDAPVLFQAIERSRQHLSPWLYWVGPTTSQDHTLNFIQQSLQLLNNQEGLALGIFLGNEIIGGLGMHQWDHLHKKAQLGYWIAKEHEGKGIIHTCATRFLDFLFEKLNLNKVEMQFVVANERSAAVAKRLGAKVEGILRESYLRNGRLEDLVVTGLLKKEWLERKKA
jgi:ribosomal-protein-serine acetyltransferase